VLEQSECVRYDPLQDEYSIVFFTDIATVNQQIAHCSNRKVTQMAKLQSPKHLSSQSGAANAHITFNSALVGFIDDTYVSTDEYYSS
jgi:hypothetical protein